MADKEEGEPPKEEGAPGSAAGSAAAGDPPGDEAPKAKMKISIPGLIALILFCGGAGMQVCSCLMMPWRKGAGSASPLYAGLLGPDFTTREYYMYYVVGLNRRSWHDLTVLTCDKAAKVEITIGSADDGICDTDLAAQLPEKCSRNFLPHVQDRCHVYNFMQSINSTFCILTFTWAALVLILGGLGMAPIMKSAKKFYFPFGMSLAFSSMALAGTWMYISDEKFTFIGRNAEFPYPGIATGFWIHLGGGGAYLLGSLFYIPAWKESVEGGGDDEEKKDEEKPDEEKDKEKEPQDI